MSGGGGRAGKNSGGACSLDRAGDVFILMRAMHRLIFAALALSLALPVQAGFLDWLLPRHEVEVIAVTDTTAAGLLRRAPTPANPIYYAALSAGYRDFGGIVAGEKIPPKEAVHASLAKVLAKLGYLPASEQHPPTILLFWAWGTMNTDMELSMNPEQPDRQLNRQQLLRFMGAYKLGMISKEPGMLAGELFPGSLFQDVDQQQLSNLATEDLYVIAVSAYDYAAMARKEKLLLWTTKISCPSRGLAMPETLPAMLALASPYIGRETARPMSVRASEKFKAEVKIGDPQVVEYLQSTPLPVANAPEAKPGESVGRAKKAAPKKKS